MKGLLGLTLLLAGCASVPPGATSSATPGATAAAEEYHLRVTHPANLEIESVRNLFGADAPRIDTLEKCDFDYSVEKMLAQGNAEQLYSTVPHYVTADPMRYHWCFYAKVLELEGFLAKGHLPRELTLEEKQAMILDRYPFFITVARIFKADLNDPKYLEFAVFNYKRLSRAYFGRELDLSSKIKEEMGVYKETGSPYSGVAPSVVPAH